MKKAKFLFVTAMAALMGLTGCAEVKTTKSTVPRVIPLRIDDTIFPDKAFREYVSYYFDGNSDGALSEEEILKATTLNVPLVGIESLQGIEWLTQLTYINCSNTPGEETEDSFYWRYYANGKNKIKELDVSKNKELVSLNCDGNELTSLDVSNNSKLVILSCVNNQLKDLDVSNNKELRRLSCHKNDLTALNLKNNTKLETLDVDVDMLALAGVGNAVTVNKHSPTEVITEDETQLIRRDDEIIVSLDKSCSALLADERYYASSDNVVKVTMDHEGEITIEGLPASEVDSFKEEVYYSLFGKKKATDFFQSYAYQNGSITSVVYTWNATLYTWDKKISNNVKDSKFYSPVEE